MDGYTILSQLGEVGRVYLPELYQHPADNQAAMEANGALIIKAANSHELLVEALKVIVLTPHIANYLSKHDIMALKQAQSALLLAK